MSNALKQQSTNSELDGTATTATKAAANTLSKGGITFLQNRGISQETAKACMIYTTKDALCFPFLEGDNVVNIKFRGANKKFWQDGGKQTLWNLKAIDDAIEFDIPLLICEGEMDGVSAIEAGYIATVSVPAGAPKEKSSGDFDKEHDSKFSYIWELQDKLDQVKQFILAGDNDDAGQALNHELQLRLGAERCRFVRNDRKDLNDVLVHDGPEKLLALIEEAPEYPVKGLYRLSDFPDQGRPPIYSTGFDGMDENLLIELGKLMIITGVPSHGKSEIADRLVFNLAKQYGWHSCVGSFENLPVPNWRDSMRRRYWNKEPYNLSLEQKAEADKFIEKHFSYIAQHPEEEHELNLEFILECAVQSVLKYGTRVLVIDPWNEIEHKRHRDENEAEYVGRALRRFKAFARQYGVLVIVVAHPQKMNEKGSIKRPSLYDISGSANWYNKADYGIIIWKPNIETTECEFDVRKIKFQAYAGRPAIIHYEYDRASANYYLQEPTVYEQKKAKTLF